MLGAHTIIYASMSLLQSIWKVLNVQKANLKCYIDIWKVKNRFISKTKSFRSEIKTFSLVSQMLTFKLAKQTSKNVVETTIKLIQINWLLVRLKDGFVTVTILHSSKITSGSLCDCILCWRPSFPPASQVSWAFTQLLVLQPRNPQYDFLSGDQECHITAYQFL